MRKITTIIAIMAIFAMVLTGCEDTTTTANHSDAATVTDATETIATSDTDVENSNEDSEAALAAADTVEAEDNTTDSEAADAESITETEPTANADNSSTTQAATEAPTATTQATSTPTATPKPTTTSTPVDTSQVTTEAPKSSTTSTPAATTHTHSWTAVYATKTVQQYASDGTTNDYNNPIYETRDVYEDYPVYETHWFNGSVDTTVATANYNASHGTNLIYSDRYSDMDFNIYLNDLGAVNCSDYTKQVQTGTQNLKTGTEKVCIGYKQLGTTTEKYVDHYECSCGATK
jgi:hypothetical protein